MKNVTIIFINNQNKKPDGNSKPNLGSRSRSK